MSDKINKTVVRNAAYRGGEFNLRERHNERKNESYHNGDIDLSRKDMNVIFYENLFLNEATGYVEKETYEQTFNRLLEEGKIVKRGLQQDAKVFDELIFDVNTAYFENNGGYEYAVSFFEEAYRLAVKEIGGEDFILSAVLHADEKNKALSEQLGRDVYHYHLHVVYVPVVQKEILWSKRTKDKSLIGTVKEVIPQISHSKKWPMRVPVERDGKTIMLNSYSLLQDRFFEHMRAAGFEGFERGERGSTAEHLTDLEYKTKMEAERLAQKTAQVQEQEQAVTALSSVVEEKQQEADTISSVVEEKQQTAASLDASISDKQAAAVVLEAEAEAKKKKLAAIEKEINAVQGKALTVKQISQIKIKIDRPTFGGADKETVTLLKSDWENVKKTAITQARKDEEYKTARAENIAFKKENAELHEVTEELTSTAERLKGNYEKEYSTRYSLSVELQNLKNAVSKIPRDIWDMYTRVKTQEKQKGGSDVDR